MKNVRINLEVSPAVRENLKDLQKRSGAASQAEVFRKALALYDMIITTVQAEGKVVLEHKAGEREVLHLL